MLYKYNIRIFNKYYAYKYVLDVQFFNSYFTETVSSHEAISVVEQEKNMYIFFINLIFFYIYYVINYYYCNCDNKY